MFNVCIEHFNYVRNYYGRMLKIKLNKVNINFKNKKKIKLKVSIFKWYNLLMLIS